MRSFTGAFVAAAAALAASGSAFAAPGSLSDFRLPPEESDSQPSPDRQGPVAPDVVESQVRPTPTATPTPTPTPTPAPAESSPDIVVPPATIGPAPRSDAAAPLQTDDRTRTDDAVQAPPAPVVSSGEVAADIASAAPETTSAQPPPPRAPEPVARPTGPVWPWAALGLLGVALAGLGAWGLHRRRTSARAPTAPQIEPLRPGNTSDPGSPARPAATSAEPLHVSLEPLRLSLTLMNATLSYRLELANRSSAAITGLVIEADMISAHASLSREEHLSGPADGADPLHRIARIEPGVREVIEGEFRLPLSRIAPIRQGSAALLLPLARFRVRRDDGATLHTYVVGQPGARQDGRMEPFRLDLGPRIYQRLAQRAFA